MELSFVQRQNLKICHCGCCWSIERKRDVGKKALAIFFPGTQEKKSPPQHGRQWHSLTMGPIVKAKREDEEKKFGMYKYMDHHRVNLQIWMIHLTLEHCGPPLLRRTLNKSTSGAAPSRKLKAVPSSVAVSTDMSLFIFQIF